jgi:CRP-like cAMP-binding protein
LKAGQILGEIALLDGGVRTANAVVHEPADLLVMERRHILPFLDRHPEGLRRMLVALCERLRWVSDLLEDASFLDLNRRLGKRLSLLARLFGQPTTDGGTRIVLDLSQQDLAALMSVTRESVNRQIRQWEQDGFLTVRKGYLVITDLDHFERTFGQA